MWLVSKISKHWCCYPLLIFIAKFSIPTLVVERAREVRRWGNKKDLNIYQIHLFQVAARCILNNNEDQEFTVGSGSDNEMCNYYLMYWVPGDRTLRWVVSISCQFVIINAFQYIQSSFSLATVINVFLFKQKFISLLADYRGTEISFCANWPMNAEFPCYWV